MLLTDVFEGSHIPDLVVVLPDCIDKSLQKSLLLKLLSGVEFSKKHKIRYVYLSPEKQKIAAEDIVSFVSQVVEDCSPRFILSLGGALHPYIFVDFWTPLPGCSCISVMELPGELNTDEDIQEFCSHLAKISNLLDSPVDMLTGKNYNLLLQRADIVNFLSTIIYNATHWSVDIETTSYPPYHKKFDLLSISFTSKNNEAFAFGLNHPQSEIRRDLPDHEEVWDLLRKVLSDPQFTWIGHNILKFDKIGLELGLGISMCPTFQDTVNRIEDTMIMKYTLDENAKGRYGLKPCARIDLKWRDWAISTKSLIEMELKTVLEYNCFDTDATFQLFHEYKSRMVKNSEFYHIDMYQLYKAVMIPNTANAAILDRNGIQANLPYAERYARQSKEKIVRIEQHIKSNPYIVDITNKKAAQIIGERKKIPIKGSSMYVKMIASLKKRTEFNCGSTAQIRHLLYDVLGLPYPEKYGRTEKKKEQKVTEETLDFHENQLRETEYKVVWRLIRSLRLYQKIKYDLANFILPVCSNAAKTRDGFSHPSFLTHGTATGRYSCRNADDAEGTSSFTGENLQKIEKSKRIRNLYTSRFNIHTPTTRGYLLQIDGQAAEVRFACIHSIAAPAVMASKHGMVSAFDNAFHKKNRDYYLERAQKHNLVKAFASGLDVHTAGTAIVMNKAPEDVTKQERTNGKFVTLGRQYGRGYKAIAKQYGVDEEEMRVRIKAWDDTFPEFTKEWHPSVKEWASAKGFTLSLFGLIRRVPDVWNSDPMWQHKALREAINAPVQGDSHMWVSKGMSWFQKNIIDSGYVSKAVIINDIHDAFMVDCPSEELDRCAISMGYAMLHSYWDHDNYPWICCDLAGDLDVYCPWGETLGVVPFNTCLMRGKDTPGYDPYPALEKIWADAKPSINL